MSTQKISIIRKSAKGAALITDGQSEAWVMPKTAKAIEAGNITAAATKALAEAAEAGSPTGNKQKCFSVRISDVVRETAKAILVADFNGNEAWLPKSAIVDFGAAEKSEQLLVKCFALKDKDITYKTKPVWV